MTSYTAKIISALSRLGKNGTENPAAKANDPVSKLLGDLYLWQVADKYIGMRKKAVEKRLNETGKIVVPDDSGEFELADSAQFAYVANVTNPVRQFDPDYLVLLLGKSKYRVPAAAAREMIEKAKRPSNRRVTKRVVEKGAEPTEAEVNGK